MNLEKYLKELKEEEKQKYDFSAENTTSKYADASSIEKYIIYKTYYTSNSGWSDKFKDGKDFRKEIRKYYSGIQDPDDFKKNPNSLLEQIYKKIWPELELCSDTMTSVQYIMSGYFESKIEEDDEKRKRAEISKRQQCSIKYMINLWAEEEGESVEEKVKNAAEKIENAAERINMKEELKAFLSAWHTLGNYCPVPSGFNGPRSNFGEHDFWDLTLIKIHDWYLTDDEMIKEEILRKYLFHNNPKGNIEACVNWLNQCGGTGEKVTREEGAGEDRWKKFVQTLSFEDWVNCDNKVIPLWKGHGWDNILLPVNDEEWKKFFLEYERRISERTKRIINRLNGLFASA